MANAGGTATARGRGLNFSTAERKQNPKKVSWRRVVRRLARLIMGILEKFSFFRRLRRFADTVLLIGSLFKFQRQTVCFLRVSKFGRSTMFMIIRKVWRDRPLIRPLGKVIKLFNFPHSHGGFELEKCLTRAKTDRAVARTSAVVSSRTLLLTLRHWNESPV